MQVTREKTDTIITVLIRLHTEANKPNITPFEFNKRGEAITFILNNVEKDFSKEYMLYIFRKTSDLLNKTLGPLKIEFVQKLLKDGFSLEKVNKYVSYTK